MSKNHKQQIDANADWIISDFIEAGLPDGAIQLLSAEETISFRNRWERVYIRPYVNMRHPNPELTLHHCSACDDQSSTMYGFNWHVFSYDLTPHRDVDQTFLCQFIITEPTILYMFEDCNLPVIRFLSEYASAFADDNRDFYLFPDDCSWTYVSTHEQPYIGPFYSDSAILRSAHLPETRIPKNGQNGKDDAENAVPAPTTT